MLLAIRKCKPTTTIEEIESMIKLNLQGYLLVGMVMGPGPCRTRPFYKGLGLNF